MTLVREALHYRGIPCISISKNRIYISSVIQPNTSFDPLKFDKNMRLVVWVNVKREYKIDSTKKKMNVIE